MKAPLAAAALIGLATPALADLAAGERAFTQQCVYRGTIMRQCTAPVMLSI
jgi:hypothetical protein